MQPIAPDTRAGETPALPAPAVHKGYYNRGYLPHFDVPSLYQFITFRLADSMPQEKLRQWEQELRQKPKAERDRLLRQQIEKWLDQGHGSCSLRDPLIATLVQNALKHFHAQRYQLLEWVVMPNHVHVLIETMEGHPLAKVVHSWKSFTAKGANQLLGKSGAYWFADYFDRFIRDEKHFEAVVEYIRNNPVEAGLVAKPEDWPAGSAGVSPARALVGAAPRAARPPSASRTGETPALPAGR